MCVIIDGMDQAKTNLPNTKHIAKSTSALWRLRTHVTGVIVYMRAPHGKRAFVFVDTLQFPHDSNLTLTLLLKSLVLCSKQRGPSENLYVQMDNTSRENKNRHVLAFCAFLVTMKIFKKVQIYSRIEDSITLCSIVMYKFAMIVGTDKLSTSWAYP